MSDCRGSTRITIGQVGEIIDYCKEAMMENYLRSIEDKIEINLSPTQVSL